jgi:hypothetical protein
MDAISPLFNKNALTKLIYNSLLLALTCLKCCSLYVGFIIGGFWCGIFTSAFAYLYMQVLAPKIDKIRFN